MDPSEGTLFRVNVDGPDFRIDIFESVIHFKYSETAGLSGLHRFSRTPADPAVPGTPVNCISISVKPF